MRWIISAAVIRSEKLLYSSKIVFDLSTPYQPRNMPQENIAFVMCATGEAVSFATLESRANQGAHLLRALGVNKGDHIAILMENRREFLEICFAADRSGIYYTTVSTHLTADEVSYILEDCSARLLISSPRFHDMIRKFSADPQTPYRIFSVGDDIPGDLENGEQNTSQNTDPDFENWASQMAGFPSTPIEDESQGLDMLYSSGTTGRPKGIKWPLPESPPGASSMLIELLSSLFGYSKDTRYLSPAPLYHAAPLRHSMVTIKQGGTAYIMDRFDAETSLKLIETHKITHSQWVPTMFVRLLKLPKDVRDRYDVSSLEMAVHAAAPCPVDVKHQMIEWWGEIVHEYYAGTENNGFTALSCQEWLKKPGSVGSAKLGVIHICDEKGQELPIGEEGEIYFENGHPFSYHNDPEKTQSCTNNRGWTTLGDIGRIDEDGYLYLTDRKSFVIISGGVNIYPQETEDTLLGHSAVLDVAVIGVPSEDFGEEVKAIVQLAKDVPASSDLAQNLIDHCKERISALKCPKTVEFRDSLPRSATGKLYKRMLRAEYWPTTS